MFLVLFPDDVYITTKGSNKPLLFMDVVVKGHKTVEIRWLL